MCSNLGTPFDPFPAHIETAPYPGPAQRPYKLVQYVALQAGSWHLTKGPSCCARGFLCDNKHIQVTKLLPVGFEVTIHGLWIKCFPYPNTSHAHFTNVIYFVSKWNGFIRFNVNCYTFEAHRLRQLHFFDASRWILWQIGDLCSDFYCDLDLNSEVNFWSSLVSGSLSKCF